MSKSLIRATWPPTLAFDIALGIHTLDETLVANGISWQEWDRISANETFKGELMLAQREVSETGMSFRRRAAIQAEMYLLDMDKLMADPGVAPSIKADIFRTMAKLGDLEPVAKKPEAAEDKPVFNIQINL